MVRRGGRARAGAAQAAPTGHDEPVPGPSDRSGGDHDPSRPATYRPLSARLLYGALVVIGVWWAAGVVRDGGMSALLPAGPVVVGLAVLGWSAFWRSAVVVDDHAVRLLNVVRDIEVAWPALEAVSARWALTLHAGGRQHRSWSATARNRAATRARVRSAVARSSRDPWLTPPSSTPGSGGLLADAADAQALVEGRWERWRMSAQAARATAAGGDGPVAPGVVVRWNVPVLVLLALSAAASVAGFAVG